MTPTKEMIAMARRIAAHALCGRENWKPGVKAGMFEIIMRGDADSEAIVQGPLAAIMETSEKAAALSERSGYIGVAAAIRNGEHLKP